MPSFAEAKRAFDDGPGKLRFLSHSVVPVDGKTITNIEIRRPDGTVLEEYYKWQFIYALIYSGLYAKDFIGVEIRFPKGNKLANPLKLDAAVFDTSDWLLHYTAYWSLKKSTALEWLNDHLIAAIEFKRSNKEIERVFSGQIKPAMREKDPSTAYVMGMYYDTERLFLFHRRDGHYLRYDEAKNTKGDESKVGDLSLHLPDPYYYIPSHAELFTRVNRPKRLDRSSRDIADLDVITSIATIQIQDALSDVLRALDKAGLVNQRGYEILVQSFALKIFDEKRNDRQATVPLQFYINDSEFHFASLKEKPIQDFIKRMRVIWTQAEAQYQKILQSEAINWKNTNHVRAVAAVCKAFQDFTFIRSTKSDLYQLVFYNFANKFQRGEAAQFLTPLPVIDFIVKIVNPRNGETLFDPCCGIADFLSLAYVNAQDKKSLWQLDDANIYGVDLDENMVMLGTLNMLLNGDGEAKLLQHPNPGSILFKIKSGNPPELVELIPSAQKNGNWDNWPDTTKLMKFDVVLTNPPFGEDRAFRPRTSFDRELIETYETWHLMRTQADAEDSFTATHERTKGRKQKGKGVEAIDLGIVFLENAVRVLKEEGRLGIVLSNSIASINKWRRVRDWFMDCMRVVALFDLPANVFAETGVNTSIIVAYKPSPEKLSTLNHHGYHVFVRDIRRVGYEKRTSKRNVFFNPIYKIDENTFEIETDEQGVPVLDEEFGQTVEDFRSWALGQEETLQRLFLRED